MFKKKTFFIFDFSFEICRFALLLSLSHFFLIFFFLLDLQNGPETGRGGFDTIENYRDWRETFLPHFEAAVKAGTSSLMCSYNVINDIHSCANSELLTNVLRNEFGFDGYVTSDCGAVPNIYSQQKFARNDQEAAEMAIKAGCDLYKSNTQETWPEFYFNKALQNVLPFWFKLG